MHHDIRTVPQWLTQIGRGKRIVHDQARANLTRDFRAGVNVANLKQWIGNRLSDHRARLRFKSFRSQRIDIAKVGEYCFDSKRSENR